MIIFNLIIVAYLIFTLILLSGVKIMYNSKYFQLAIAIFVMSTLISKLIEGYKLGEISINYVIIVSLILLITIIWTYIRSTHTYCIHNVKENDVISIIENYLHRKNIKYELRSEEIYFPDLNRTLFVRHLLQTNLECRYIKDADFYHEFIESIRSGIKEIKQRHFSMDGLFNLVFVLFLLWIKFTFLK